MTANISKHFCLRKCHFLNQNPNQYVNPNPIKRIKITSIVGIYTSKTNILMMQYILYPVYYTVHNGLGLISAMHHSHLFAGEKQSHFVWHKRFFSVMFDGMCTKLFSLVHPVVPWGTKQSWILFSAELVVYNYHKYCHKGQRSLFLATVANR